jgi:uncharacterized protein
MKNILVAAFVALALVSSAEAAGKKNTISVTGTAEVNIAPDMAHLSLGVVTQAPTVVEAQRANAERTTALTRLILSDLKIAEKDLASNGYQINQVWDYVDNKRVFRGYEVRHSLSLTVREFGNLGGIIDALGATGANELGGISFASSRQKELELSVLDAAMADARKKADILARASGRSVKSVLRVVQGVAASPRPMVMAARAASAESAPTVIHGGELTVSNTVTVVFEM